MANVSGDRGLRRSVGRLVLVIALALLGLALAEALRAWMGVRPLQLADSPLYAKSISALLAVGLFASAFSISRGELRRNARIVLLAITTGVAFKAMATGGIMALAYGSAGYLLLGVAMAQIDPLSVAASLRDSRMSVRARSVLSAWASFDDPVTVLLVVYLASVTLPGAARHGPGAMAGAGSGARQLALNAALVAVAALAWPGSGRLGRNREREALRNVVRCLVLAGLLAAAASFGLLAGITVCGLFFRPPIDRVLTASVSLAFYGATFLLGLLLLTGVNVAAGALLGVSVFGVQVVTGTIISRGMPRDDRVHLALGQQNGLTAIVLALALEPYLPAAVGIIAVAILVVNALHIASNGIWHFLSNAAPGPGIAGTRAAAVSRREGTHAAAVSRREQTGAAGGELGSAGVAAPRGIPG